MRVPDHRPVRLDAEGRRGRRGVVPHLQRVDGRRPGPLAPLQLRGPGAGVDGGRCPGRGGVDRRVGPGRLHAADGGGARLEPPHLGTAVVGHGRDRPPGGDAPGHRAQHVLLPGSGRGRLQPAGHPDDGAPHGRPAGHVGRPRLPSRPARRVRRVQRRVAGVDDADARLLHRRLHALPAPRRRGRSG